MTKKMPQREFELDGWIVEPARGVLRMRDSGKEVRIEPLLMELLLLFAASDGRVLSKSDIIANVWGGRAVGDDTLAAAISRLRSALGDTKETRYIETVPKRGYRFLRNSPAQTHAHPPGRESSRAANFMRLGESALRVPIATSLAEARNAFEAAIAEEPGLAAAHAGLAESLLAQHTGGGKSSLLAAAKAAALAAIGLDKDLAGAWSTLGMCKLLMDRDSEAADRDLLHALALDPHLTAAHLGRAFLLASMGRFVEAERACRKAVEFDSLSVAARNFLLQVLIAARRYRPAIAAANELAMVAPHAAESWYAKGWANVFLGEQASAVEAFVRGLELWGLPRKKLDRLKSTFLEEGFVAGCAAAADLFEEQGLVFRPRATDIAILRVASRQFDSAIMVLEQALKRDDPYLLFLRWLPHFDPIRNDPRFVALLERIRPVR